MMVEIHQKKLAFRTGVLMVAFGLALLNPSLLEMLFFLDLGLFRFHHLLWLLLMLGMFQVFIPAFNDHVSCGRMFAKHYTPSAHSYTQEQLEDSVRRNNRGALRAAMVWLVVLSLIGWFRWSGWLGNRGIHLLVVFFYFADEFCINVWCPFRVWIVRNTCCNTCRIFNWGHFMMFSPYLFLPQFWTWSLLAVSTAILIQWEIMNARHSHRFSILSNAKLQCVNCLQARCRYMQQRRLEA